MKIDLVRGAVAAAALQLAVLTVTAFAAPALAEDISVNIDNFTFNPPRLTVTAGTTSISRMPSIDLSLSAPTFIGPGFGAVPASGCGKAGERAV